MNLKGVKGALVADVTADSPGQKAGIQPGDVITEFDGRPIREMRSLPRAVGEADVGKKVIVKVLRKGQEMSFDVELGRLEDGEKLAMTSPATDPNAPATATLLGMTVSSMTPELQSKFKVDADVKGVLVTEVAEGGLAADKRIEQGDVIVEAGGKKVENAGEISAAVDAAEKDGKTSVLFLIAKAGKSSETRFIALRLKK